MNTPCPCGSTKLYSNCCQPLHKGERQAATAEELMRSRYSGYVMGELDYVLHTWHLSTRPNTIAPNTIANWTALTIISAEHGQPGDKHGTVEFKAVAATGLTNFVLHERSMFLHEDGRWLYLNGKDLSQQTAPTMPNATKTGRNAPCPCGSGKKYKRCCGA